MLICILYFCTVIRVQCDKCMCINPLAITDELSMRFVIFLIAFFQAHQYYYCSSHINLVPIKGLLELVGCSKHQRFWPFLVMSFVSQYISVQY